MGDGGRVEGRALPLLLDTHPLLWWAAGDDRISDAARAAIAGGDEDVFVSAASIWEIATKFRLGKLPGAAVLVSNLQTYLADQSFRSLPIGLDHAARAGSLPGPHRDPFDRMLIAQALHERYSLVSNEILFDAYGVRRLW